MNEYENIETLETVENDLRGSSVAVVGSDDSVLSGSVGTESDLVQDAGAVAENSSSDTMGSGTSGKNVYVLDNAGNYIPLTVSGSDASVGQMEIQDLSANDFETYFTAINYRLDTIIFLLLSFWCIKRIKIAVANFTGRSLDGRKDGLDR